jgi:C4-dicarboxylate transporter, DctM subunit
MTTVLVLVAVLLLLVFSGVPIGFSIGIVGAVGLYITVGDRTLDVFSTFSQQVTNGFTLAAVPLFLLMGEFMYRSGVAEDVFVGMARLTRHLPGQLLQANILTSGLFAASSGSSVASAAALAPMSYQEESVRRKYDPPIVLGSIAAGGTLGILIPPSGILIIYGVATNQSITTLFAAALVPGLVLAFIYSVYVAVRTTLNRDLIPVDASLDPPAPGKLAAVRDMAAGSLKAWPLLLIAGIVLVLLYGGIATPTETAAIGALAAFVIALLKRRVTVPVIAEVLASTARTTSMIFLLIIAAQGVTLMLAYYGVPGIVREAASGMSPGLLLAFVCLAYLVLGLFFDGISIMVLTLPVIVPAMTVAGYDLVWFGVIAVVLIEIGLLTPPVGLNLFVVQGSTGADLSQVIRGSAPFVLLQFVFVLLLTAVPSLALWLPGVLAG